MAKANEFPREHMDAVAHVHVGTLLTTNPASLLRHQPSHHFFDRCAIARREAHAGMFSGADEVKVVLDS